MSIDLLTGTERWRASVGVAYISAIREEGDLVYVLGYNLCGLDRAELVALDHDDGSVLWQHPSWGYGCHSDRDDRILIDSEVVLTCEDAALVVRSTLDGAERWRRLGCDAPYISNGLVVHAEHGDRLTALDLTTGETRWSVFAAAVKILAGGDEHTVVYITESGNYPYEYGLIAFDTTNGATRWSLDLGDSRPPSADVAGGLLAFTSTGPEPSGVTIHVLDLLSGRGISRIPFALSAATSAGRLKLLSGTLYAYGRYSALVTAYDPYTGDEFELPGDVLARYLSPGADGLVVVQNGNVVSIRRDDAGRFSHGMVNVEIEYPKFGFGQLVIYGVTDGRADYIEY